MTIDNQKKAVALRIQKSLVILVFIILIGLIYFVDIIPRGVAGFTRNEIAIVLIVMFVLFFLFHYLRNHNYIFYSDTGDNFILRYFSLRPLHDRKNAIEFNKREFERYEIKRSFAGLNESVIIYRKTSKGVAKYPPVSITALDKKSREKLLASFQKILGSGRAAR
jgi:hypothetical protein